MGAITDDPSPFGEAWQPFRSIPSSLILNPEGYARGDGRPDLTYRTASPGGPVVVWAYKVGSDHDIALAEWDGAAWGAIVFLTVGTDDDVDPRIFVEQDGTMHVVWWLDGAIDRVLLTTKPAYSSVWDAPLEVVSGGRRPSVTVFNGELRVSYERDSGVAGMAQDSVVVRCEAGGVFVEEFVASTARIERLDPVLHGSGIKLWLDWKHGSQTFGYAVYGPNGWGTIEEPSWPESTWVGVEETRKLIRNEVLGN